MVRMGRLELPRLSALEPKSSVSTYSTTSANRGQETPVLYGPRRPSQLPFRAASVTREDGAVKVITGLRAISDLLFMMKLTEMAGRMGPKPALVVNQVDKMLRRALPGRCAFCLARCMPNVPWCGPCLAVLPWNRHACVQCAEPLPAASPRYCGHCLRRPPAFAVARIGLRYEDEIALLLRRFKFGYDPRAGNLLVSLMNESLAGLEREQLPELLIALPRHRQRAREQGFDPGPWLTERLAARLGLPWYQPRRLHATPSQRGLDRLARRRNLKGAFAVETALPERIALVDDVMTTGASLDALAVACRGAGARHVEAWAVARTPLGH